MRARLVLALLLSIALTLLSACGGGSHHNKAQPQRYDSRAPASQLGRLCPPGRSHLGCAVARPKQGQKRPTRPAGCLIPDDYEGDGGINYAVAKPHICGAIIKAGEGSYYLDHAYWSRLISLRRLNIWHAPYWFVRGGDCNSEGRFMVARIRATGLDSGPLVLDMETPDAYGKAVCLAVQAFAAFHRWPVIYTAPGTWPGGSAGGLKAWIATYGNSHGCLTWTCTFVAWQFAAPPWIRYYIPGVGVGDVSVDYGITQLLPGPPPPPPDPLHYGLLTPTERQWVLRYDGARKHPDRYGAYLRDVLQPELGKLAHVIWLAHGRDHTSWAYRHRGTRFQSLWRRHLGQRLA